MCSSVIGLYTCAVCVCVCVCTHTHKHTCWGQGKRILLCPKHKAESENETAQMKAEQTYLGGMNT